MPNIAAVSPSPTESTTASVSDYKSNSESARKHNESNTVATGAVDEAQRPPVAEWEPSNHEKAVIYTLAITSLIVALDATIVITPLSVSSPFHENGITRMRAHEKLNR